MNEKINFVISAKMKKDIERLANSHGMNVSKFMIVMCTAVVDANKDRIAEQARREKDSINFGGVTQSASTKRKTARRKATPEKAEGVTHDE